MFVTLTFEGVLRDTDGTINMQGFLVLADTALKGVGAWPEGTASFEIGELPEDLTHNHAESWYNEDPMRHWRECECGDRADLADHSFEWIVTKEATETSTGSKHEECSVCGFKKPAVTTYYEDPGTPDEPEPDTPVENPPISEGPVSNDNTGIIIAVVMAVIVCAAVVILVLRRKKKS